MSAPKWDALPDDWSVTLEPVADPGTVHPKHPLASKGGIQALSSMLGADAIWRNLTKPQRELLLSAVAGFPIKARSDVRRRLAQRGLITLLSAMADVAEPTDAGRFVVQWRLP